MKPEHFRNIDPINSCAECKNNYSVTYESISCAFHKFAENSNAHQYICNDFEFDEE